MGTHSFSVNLYLKRETHVIHPHVHKMEFVESLTEQHLVNIPNAFKMRIVHYQKLVSIRNVEILAWRLVELMQFVTSSTIKQFVHVLEVSWAHHSSSVLNWQNRCRAPNVHQMTNVLVTKHASIRNASILARMEFADKTLNAAYRLIDPFACAVMDLLETPDLHAMKLAADPTANAPQQKLA